MSERPKPDKTLIESIKHAITKVELDNVFIRRGDPELLAPLAEVIKRCVGEVRWERNPNRSTTSTIRKAISTKLPDKLSGRNPDAPWSSAEGALYGGKPEREIAMLLCGFGEYPEAGTKPPTYKDFRTAAVAYADVRGKDGRKLRSDDTSIKRMITVIWEDLTQALLDMAEQAERARDASATATLEAEYVVDRPKVREAFKTAIHHGNAAVTWVDGPLGSGKATAVKRVISRTGELTAVLSSTGEPVIWIDCATVTSPYGVMSISGRIAKILADNNMPVPGHEEALRRQLIDWMCSPSAPPYVIIDNHEAGTFPEIVQPHDFESHVIVVSYYPPPDSLEADRISVGRLEDGEAKKLVQHFIPEASDDDCLDLADALFWRPRLLAQACKGILSAGQTIADYLDSITTRRAFMRSINSAADDFDLEVSAHYKFLLDGLANKPRALRALDIIVNILEKTPVNTLKIFWSSMHGDYVWNVTDIRDPENYSHTCVRIEDVSPTDHREFDRAVRELQRVDLVGIVDGSITCDSLTRVFVIELRKKSVLGCGAGVLFTAYRAIRKKRLDWESVTANEVRNLFISAIRPLSRMTPSEVDGTAVLDLPENVGVTNKTVDIFMEMILRLDRARKQISDGRDDSQSKMSPMEISTRTPIYTDRAIARAMGVPREWL